MKISINSAIFNAVAARMTSTAAKYTAIAVQKGVADSKELSGLTALASELPFFANLKEKATKIVTISKEAEQLNIEINDDYIIGSINLGFDLYDRVADSAVSMIKEIDIWNKESKQFEAKWAEEPTDANQFDLPLDVLNAVRTTYSIPPFFTKEQVAINVAEKEIADELAYEQALEKAKQEKEVAKIAEQTQQSDTNQPE